MCFQHLLIVLCRCILHEIVCVVTVFHLSVLLCFVMDRAWIWISGSMGSLVRFRIGLVDDSTGQLVCDHVLLMLG